RRLTRRDGAEVRVAVWDANVGDVDHDELRDVVWMLREDGVAQLVDGGRNGFDDEELFRFLCQLSLPDVDRFHRGKNVHARAEAALDEIARHPFRVERSADRRQNDDRTHGAARLKSSVWVQ